MKRLQSDNTVTQLLPNFIPLKVDASSPDFQTLAQKYAPPGQGIPMIYVISSSGQEIDKISGAPRGEGLPNFLKRSLSRVALEPPGPGGPSTGPEEETGREPSNEPSEAEIRAKQRRLDTLIRRAANFMKKSDLAATAKIVGPLLDDSTNPASNELDQLVSSLEAQADKVLAVVAGRLESSQVLLAAVALTEAERIFAPLTSLAAPLAAAREKVSAAPGGNTALRQAEAVDVARAAEASRDLSGALAGYRAVVESFPNTPVAKMASMRMAQLQSATSSSDQDVERAASMLKMAKAIAERDPEKAEKYLKKVVELAPRDSREATQARALLGKL